MKKNNKTKKSRRLQYYIFNMHKENIVIPTTSKIKTIYRLTKVWFSNLRGK